jgi:hypothetical protein
LQQVHFWFPEWISRLAAQTSPLHLRVRPLAVERRRYAPTTIAPGDAVRTEGPTHEARSPIAGVGLFLLDVSGLKSPSESAHAERDRQLATEITTLFTAHQQRYGSPRIHRLLAHAGGG